MASKRIRQINELLRHELAPLLLTELTLPAGTLVTITTIDTSPDLSYADITVSVHPESRQSKTVAVLEKQAGHLRHMLAEKLMLRKMPLLRFHPDTTIEHVAHIDELIDKIHEAG